EHETIAAGPVRQPSIKDETIMVRRFRLFGFCLISLVSLVASMSSASEPKTDAGSEAKARDFIADHEANVRPLEHASALAWWNANVSGRAEDFKAKEEAQNRLDAALANPERFALLKTLATAGLNDSQLARQIAVLYLVYLEKQVEPALLRQITAK